MDLNKINKNILCLLAMTLVFIISLSINSRVFADNVPKDFEDNINLYGFNLDFPTDYYSSNDYEQQLLDKAKIEDKVVSGNWYYFVCRTSFTENWGDAIFLVNKSLLDSNYLKLVHYNGIFGLALSQTKLWSGTTFDKNNIIVLESNCGDIVYSTGWWNYLYNKSGYSCIPLQCYRSGSSSDYTINVPLATNYTGDIVYFDKDNTKHFVLLNSPYILNSNKELASLSNDTLYIEEGSYFGEDKILKLYNNTTNTEIFNVNVGKDPFGLAYTKDISDYLGLDVFHFGLAIPFSDLPTFHYIAGNSYTWSLNFGDNGVYTTTVVASVSGSFGNAESSSSSNKELLDNQNKNTEKLLESNKETQNMLEEQTQAIKENNETNKNIFQKIGDIFDILNPFSENFFGRKLVDLILDGLKSLFVPSNDFMVEFFGGLSDWFEKRLGFLWTPVDVVVTFLEKLYDSDFGEPIIHIPNIQEPFTGVTLFSETDINFNDINNNAILKNVHDVYLFIIDFTVYMSLIVLSYNTLVGIFRGSPDSISVNESEDEKAVDRARFLDKVKSYRKRG